MDSILDGVFSSYQKSSSMIEDILSSHKSTDPKDTEKRFDDLEKKIEKISKKLNTDSTNEDIDEKLKKITTKVELTYNGVHNYGMETNKSIDSLKDNVSKTVWSVNTSIIDTITNKFREYFQNLTSDVNWIRNMLKDIYKLQGTTYETSKDGNREISKIYDKLNDVSNSVKALNSRFNTIESKLNSLDAKLSQLKK